jgi:hypothetical protein
MISSLNSTEFMLENPDRGFDGHTQDVSTQTPFAERIRREAEIMTCAVGMITFLGSSRAHLLRLDRRMQ